MTGAGYGHTHRLALPRAFARTAVFACLWSDPVSAETNPASLLVFGSLEASPSVFATTGAKLALDRLDREGFVALASIGAGPRTEPALVRQTIGFAAVFGYQWVRDWGVVAAYVGPEGSVEVLSGAAGSGILPARLGLRLHGELWARPSEDTLLTATLILGSARTSAWSRMSWGARLWGAYLGPEATLYGDHTGYAKWSVGLHATDFKIGRFSFRASAGYQRTTEARSGSPYVAFDVWTPW